MKSEVYFTDPTAKAGRSLLHKVSDLFDRAGGPAVFRKGDRVAVKVHFGEEGNTSYLEPSFARLLVKKLKELGARPFLTDTNTLYRGGRHRTKDHLLTARKHGFSEETIGAPIVIADKFVKLEGAFPGGGTIRVAKAVLEADGLLVVTHVTGHMLFGLGGAVKNVSMGCASPVGKQNMHSDLKPKVNPKKCVACGTCVEYCPVKAIVLKKGEKARIRKKVCIGCGECITVCPAGAIPPLWKTEPGRLAEKSAAYARAVLGKKLDRLLCFNFLIGVAPDCDCCDWSEPPFVPDLGVLASRDIVAIDQASADLVLKAPLIPGCRAVATKINVSKKKITPQVASQFNCLPRLRDKFKSLFGVEMGPFLAAPEESGLGSRDYKLKKVL